MKRLRAKYKPLKCKTPLDEGGHAAIHRVKKLRRKKGACYPWMDRATLLRTFDDHIELYRVPPASKRRADRKRKPRQPRPIKLDAKKLRAKKPGAKANRAKMNDAKKNDAK